MYALVEKKRKPVRNSFFSFPPPKKKMAKDVLSYENPFDDFPDDLPEDVGNNDDVDKCDDVFDDDDDDFHFSNEVDDIDVHAGDGRSRDNDARL